MTPKKTIVISAVNLVSGGPLTILKDCLAFLSASPLCSEYRIVALVHRRELCDYPHIEYIEFPNSHKHWINRIYYEYFHFKKLSKQLSPYLWLSLHDMTPNVRSERQAVYMHNPSIVNRIKWRDFKFDKTYILFALFYKYLYRINIKKNNYCIVQQNWFKEVCSDLFSLPRSRFIVARPNIRIAYKTEEVRKERCRTFFFPSLPRPFKNFETVCEAARILESKGIGDLQVVVTLHPDQNAYAKHVADKYKDVAALQFVGLLSQPEMQQHYESADCLIFPSRLETWGLPISEFIAYNKPMIVADEAYAHETAQGGNAVSFFSTHNASELAARMEEAYLGDFHSFHEVPREALTYPFANNYNELFAILLGGDKMMYNRIANKYSFADKIKLGFQWLRTKLFYPGQRIIRRPFSLRGGELVDLGNRLTTGTGCRIEAFLTGNDRHKKIKFGSRVQINDYVHLSALDSIEIGDDVLIASHVYISDNSHGSYSGDTYDTPPDVPPTERPYATAPVRIGDRVWIGEGVIVMPGTTIGSGSIIGAHSVVKGVIPADTIAAGTPARPIKRWNRESGRWERIT